MDPQEKINTLRNKIDDLDNQILDFLVQRFSISREIGDIKASSRIKISDPEKHSKRIMNKLKNDLRMSIDPMHIECFDNSNIQGSNPVSGLVCFMDVNFFLDKFLNLCPNIFSVILIQYLLFFNVT